MPRPDLNDDSVFVEFEYSVLRGADQREQALLVCAHFRLGALLEQRLGKHIGQHGKAVQFGLASSHIDMKIGESKEAEREAAIKQRQKNQPLHTQRRKVHLHRHWQFRQRLVQHHSDFQRFRKLCETAVRHVQKAGKHVDRKLAQRIDPMAGKMSLPAFGLIQIHASKRTAAGIPENGQGVADCVRLIRSHQRRDHAVNRFEVALM